MYRPLLNLEKDDIDVCDISPYKTEKRTGEQRQQPQSWTMLPLLHNPRPRPRTHVPSQRGNGGGGLCRKANQYPDKACYVIIEVSLVGEILMPN
jgi:hypothetical protein